MGLGKNDKLLNERGLYWGSGHQQRRGRDSLIRPRKGAKKKRQEEYDQLLNELSQESES